jgi:mannose-1-phosphate guanylyltransferase
MKIDIIINPVVMAGGVGSQLWPLSRAAFPKRYQVLLPAGLALSMLSSHNLITRC